MPDKFTTHSLYSANDQKVRESEQTRARGEILQPDNLLISAYNVWIANRYEKLDLLNTNERDVEYESPMSSGASELIITNTNFLLKQLKHVKKPMALSSQFQYCYGFIK